MSAFIVSKTHIDAMLTAGLHRPWRIYGDLQWYDVDDTQVDPGCYQPGEPWGPGSIRWHDQHVRRLTEDTAGVVGAMLLAENRTSVNHRYAEEEWEEPYEFSALRGVPDPVVILKAIACYEYQSCEHPQWKTSEAGRFCDALAARMVHHLPGYDEAPGWEISDRAVFLKSRSDRRLSQ